MLTNSSLGTWKIIHIEKILGDISSSLKHGLCKLMGEIEIGKAISSSRQTIVSISLVSLTDKQTSTSLTKYSKIIRRRKVT